MLSLLAVLKNIKRFMAQKNNFNSILFILNISLIIFEELNKNKIVYVKKINMKTILNFIVVKEKIKKKNNKIAMFKKNIL
jgi:hypothetical protein